MAFLFKFTFAFGQNTVNPGYHAFRWSYLIGSSQVAVQSQLLWLDTCHWTPTLFARQSRALNGFFLSVYLSVSLKEVLKDFFTSKFVVDANYFN